MKEAPLEDEELSGTGDLALCVELLPLRWGRDSHMQELTTLTMQGALGYCLAIN